MEGIKKIELPTHSDARGDLSVAELHNYIDWPVKRVYYVANVTQDRGGHTVKGEKKIYIMMQGSCTAKFFDGNNWEVISLKQHEGIILDRDLWREFEDFSSDAVLAAISNVNYDENLYIRDIEEYKQYVKHA